MIPEPGPDPSFWIPKAWVWAGARARSFLKGFGKFEKL